MEGRDGAEDEHEDGEDWLPMKDEDDAWLRPSPYLQRIDTILEAILQSPCYSRLFTDEERQQAMCFLPSSGMLSSNARELYTRLLGRRPCWFRVSKLLSAYSKERFARAADVVLMGLKELEAQGLVSKLSRERHGLEEALAAIEETLDLETLRNPKVVAVDVLRKCSGSSKDSIMDMLRRRMRTGSFFGSDPFQATLQQIEKGLRDLMVCQGEYALKPEAVWAVIVRREGRPTETLRRMIRLYLSTSVVAMREPISVAEPIRWCVDLLAAFGMIKFEKYRCQQPPQGAAGEEGKGAAGVSLWASREDFLQWERACELYRVMMEFCARKRGGLSTDDLRSHAASLLKMHAVGVGSGSAKPGGQILDGREKDEQEGTLGWEVIEAARGVLQQVASRDGLARKRSSALRWHLDITVLLDEDGNEIVEPEPSWPTSAASQGDGGAHINGRPAFLSSFTCESVLVELISDTLLEGSRLSMDREQRIGLLRLLLQLDFCVHRRGRWWDELAKQVESKSTIYQMKRDCSNGTKSQELEDVKQLQERRKRQAGGICRLALQDPFVGGADRMAISRRLAWCEKKTVLARGSSSNTKASSAAPPPPSPPLTREEEFLGVQWPANYTPTVEVFDGTRQNCTTGIKSIVVSMEDQVVGRDVYTNVETLVLELYSQEEHGSWWGVHTEGSILRTLFSLVFWDVLFMDDEDLVSGAFLSSYQTAPLDLLLHPWVFYERRREAIDALLQRLEGMEPGELGRVVYDTYVAKLGMQCVGVSWNRVPVEILQAVAMGLGAKTLSLVFRPLIIKYRSFSGGLPDLLMLRVVELRDNDGDRVLSREELGEWLGLGVDMLEDLCWSRRRSSQQGDATSPRRHKRLEPLEFPLTLQVRLVEVKGPQDSLMETQKAWLVTLEQAGVDAKVCQLVEPAKEKSRKRRSLT